MSGQMRESLAAGMVSPLGRPADLHSWHVLGEISLAVRPAGKLRRVRRFVRQYRLAEAPPSLAWIAVRGAQRYVGLPADGRPHQASSVRPAGGRRGFAGCGVPAQYNPRC